MKSTFTLWILFCICWLQVRAQLTEHSFKNTKSAIAFQENKGQISDQDFKSRPDVLFSGTAGQFSFHIRNNGISYQISKVDQSREFSDTVGSQRLSDRITIQRIDINWLNASQNITIHRDNLLEGYSNYFLAGCPSGVSRVPSYTGITLKNVYPGIDVHYFDKDGFLKCDFIITPNADYEQITLGIKGADIELAQDGKIILKTPLGEIMEDTPVAYQNGKELSANWVVSGSTVKFRVMGVDPDLPLIIDPVTRLWATYYGDVEEEINTSCSADAYGNVYFGGVTNSTSSIATSGAHQTQLSDWNDAFLVKLDANGSRKWATYYGGSDVDICWACAVYGPGEIIIAGETKSDTAISTNGCHQPNRGGWNDGFLIKFDSTGARQWGTYYGGSQIDVINGCAVDGSGNILICGYTHSTNAIGTPGSHQNFLSGDKDAFITKLNDQGQRIWGTYYGGNNQDQLTSVVADASGNIYTAGMTSSTNAIASSNAHQQAKGGSQDAFLVKFNSTGTRKWGTYFGGSETDHAHACMVDNNAVYLSGATKSDNAIATNGSYQSMRSGDFDAYLSKFNFKGAFVWGTYYGGPGEDFSKTCSTDGSGNIYIGGYTLSKIGIATSGSHQPNPGSNATFNPYDAFLARFKGNGQPKAATFYGGSHDDLGYCTTVDANGDVYLGGATTSTTNIATLGSFKASYSGPSNGFSYFDMFAVKFKGCLNSTFHLMDTACMSYDSPSGQYTWNESGVYLDTIPNSQGCDSIITIDLSVVSIDTSISQSWDTLYSAENMASYQWLDCTNDYATIAGETEQSFRPSINGIYAVVISKDGCIDTSACFAINNVGTGRVEATSLVIYPNPTNEDVMVSSRLPMECLEVRVLNSIGQEISMHKFHKTKQAMVHMPETEGMYMLVLNDVGRTVMRTIVIKAEK